MDKYHKIQSIFKRDEKGRMIWGEFSRPELGYLADLDWSWTEKVDGTNVRVHWERGTTIKFGGRTDNAQMPMFLLDKLAEIMALGKFDANIEKADSLTLYGEGYGARIQKGGGNYIPDGVSFVLFDVKCGDVWLDRGDVLDVANGLGLEVVPMVGEGSLDMALDYVEARPSSYWGDFTMEGLVLRPSVELQTKTGSRIITKIKCRDFDNRS